VSAAELLHLALATAAAAAALWAWLAARPAEAGGPAALPFARATTLFAAVTGVQLLAGLWVLGRLPHRIGQALVGGEALPTVALLLALVTSLSAIRLGWTAHRRPAPRRTAAVLALHLLVLGLCMGAMAEAVGLGLPPGP
jgi:hypothetical protein